MVAHLGSTQLNVRSAAKFLTFTPTNLHRLAAGSHYLSVSLNRTHTMHEHTWLLTPDFTTRPNDSRLRESNLLLNNARCPPTLAQTHHLSPD